MSPRKPSPRFRVTVQIGGEKHVLRSDAPPDYTRACAAHVDTVLRELPDSPALEPGRAAILAALSITDELFRAREEVRRLRAEMERRADEMAEILERAAGEERPAEG